MHNEGIAFGNGLMNVSAKPTHSFSIVHSSILQFLQTIIYHFLDKQNRGAWEAAYMDVIPSSSGGARR